MQVFWANGYAAASVDVLSRAMNVPRASLYQTFGDKEELFLATVAHYGNTRIARILRWLDGETDAQKDLEGFFDDLISLATGHPEMTGCLIACVLADAAGKCLKMRVELSGRFATIEARLTERIVTAQAAGQIDSHLPAPTLAVMLAATARGLMVRARADAGPDELHPAAMAVVALCCRTEPV
jgi:AcrR family transcriptional regulator